MDFMEIMKIIGFAVSTFVIYRLFVHEQKDKTKGHYTRPGDNKQKHCETYKRPDKD